MPSRGYVPHVDMLLQSLRINRERLNSRSKIAVDARVLKTLIQEMAARAPFSAEQYRAAYPDIAAAHEAGTIPDLHEHYIQTGFFEGRFGALPDVDEAFYCRTYPDVGEAVARGDLASGAEHYQRSGAAEGRVPNQEVRSEVDAWIGLLRSDG